MLTISRLERFLTRGGRAFADGVRAGLWSTELAALPQPEQFRLIYQYAFAEIRKSLVALAALLVLAAATLVPAMAQAQAP